jgi:serine/threonine protein kinase
VYYSISRDFFETSFTATYVAPEILKNVPYDQSADMWSVGVVLYVLLVGYPPFADSNQSVLFQRIRTGDYVFHEEEWKGISEDAKDLIRHLLVVDPQQRWTAKQALQSVWINKQDVGAELTASLEAIQRSKRKFKNVARTIMMMKGSSKRAVEAREKAMDVEEFDKRDSPDPPSPK